MIWMYSVLMKFLSVFILYDQCTIEDKNGNHTVYNTNFRNFEKFSKKSPILPNNRKISGNF